MTKANNSALSVALSPEMKIYELIDAAPMLLSLFSRLDIHFPFGDISIAEMCRRDGYNPQLFMMLCAMHIDSRYRPSQEEMTEDMLPATWSQEQRADYIADGKRRSERSKWMLAIIVPFFVSIAADALYLFTWPMIQSLFNIS